MGNLVRSGNVYMLHDYLRRAGISGFYWSGSGSDNTNAARHLYFGFLDANLSASPTNRHRGYSLRCLQE